MILDKAINVVCLYYRITESELVGPCRKREFIRARQMFCYVCHKGFDVPSSAVGRRINRNHATVLHACNQLEGFANLYENVRVEIEEVCRDMGRTDDHNDLICKIASMNPVQISELYRHVVRTFA